MRASEQARRKGRRGSHDSDGGLVPMRSRASKSLDDYVEDLLDREGPAKVESAAPPPTTASQGSVVQTAASRCWVRPSQELDNSAEPFLCRFPATGSGETTPVIGDAVLFSPPAADGDGTGSVHAVLPRQTVLARRDPAVPERCKVIAANIDPVVVVVAAKNPPLRARLIDRFLIAIQRGGASACIVVNKCDLIDERREDPRAILAPYEQIGVPVFWTCAAQGEGLDELRRGLAGRTVAFVGHSGVGKSSLIAALDPQLNIDTGNVNDFTGKGRHTTTASTLYSIPVEEGSDRAIRVIDTPGIRQFGIENLDRDELLAAFPEFERPAKGCRFHDCAHDREPDCGVRQAVEDGTLPKERWEAYRALLPECQ